MHTNAKDDECHNQDEYPSEDGDNYQQYSRNFNIIPNNTTSLICG